MAERVRLVSGNLLVSKPGKSVSSADMNDFLVNFGIKNARYAHREVVTTLYQDSAGSTSYSYYYYHGLGFVPWAYVSDESPSGLVGANGGNPTIYEAIGTATSTYVKVNKTFVNSGNQPAQIGVVCHLSVYAEQWA